MSGDHHHQHQNHSERRNKYLPNWDQAYRHKLAARVGKYSQDDKNICACCHEPIHKQEITLCQDTKSLEFLGFGFPLFYMFLRNCIVLLFLLVMTEGIISTYISIQEGVQYCQKNPPAQHTSAPQHHQLIHLNYLSQTNIHNEEAQGHKIKKLYLAQKCNNFLILLARTQKRQSDYQVIFRSCSFIIQVFYLLYMKDSLLKRLEYYDERESDLSDFTVIIKSIPEKTLGIKNRLNRFLYERFLTDKTDKQYVHQIVLIPNVKEIKESAHHFEHKLQHYLQHQTQQNLHHVEQAEQVKNDIVYNTIHKIRDDTIQSKEVILIFETEDKKFQFMDFANQPANNQVLAQYFGSSQPIIVQQAPEPKEIIYENLQYQHVRGRLILVGWGLSLLFLAFITLVFYFIQLLKTNKLVSAIELLQENPNSQEAQKNKIFAAVIAWVCLLGIVFFNKFVMGRILHYFTHLEKHDNKAHEDFSFAFKYALGMFFTTALMTILVQALKFKNYYNHDFGVIQQESIMFILCAFIIPLIWAINPFQLLHVYERKKHYLSSKISQHEANHLMADYHYDMGKRFAEIIQMLWFTFLYADLIPAGGILIMIGLMVYYWIDKYNLLRRASLQGNISASIVLSCMRLLDATLFWRFLGQLIFDIQIRDGAQIQTLIFLALSIIYLIVPWQTVLEYVNNEQFKLNEKTYSTQKKRFIYDNYKVHHPVYKELVVKQHEKGGQREIFYFDLLNFGINLSKNNHTNQNDGIQQQQKLLENDLTKYLKKPINVNHAGHNSSKPTNQAPLKNIFENLLPHSPVHTQ